MPPFFIYALVFLCVLVAIGFVACLREGNEAQTRMPEPRPVAPRAPERRMAAEPQGAPPAMAPPRSLQPAGPVAAASPAATGPASRRTILPGAADTPAPAAPTLAPARWTTAALGADAAPAPRAPDAIAVRPDPAADPLALQVAELTRQVAELKAERRSFEDEIHRLQEVVREAVAAVGELNAARPPRQARGGGAGARHINIQDLRLRRLG